MQSIVQLLIKRRADNPKVPIFFEVKGRVSERTYKKRMRVKYQHLNYFLNQNHNFKLLNLYPNNEMIKNFAFDSLRKNLKPRIIVDYKRRPYINKFGLYFRLTFDTNLLGSKANNLFSDDKYLSWLECKAGFTILEVKFDRSIPAWFHRIIQCYNLRRRSISKFVMGISTCGLATETSE